MRFYFRKEQGKKIISRIVLDSTCNCKTEKGVGMNSSFEEVKSEWGQPYFPADHVNPQSPMMGFSSNTENGFDTYISYSGGMDIELNGVIQQRAGLSELCL